MQYCKCIPWDYPLSDQTLETSKMIGICDFFGSSCFNSYIENMKNKMPSWCREECAPGCNEIKYTTTTEREPIDTKSICSYDPTEAKNVLDEFGIKTFQYLFNTSYAGKEEVIHFQQALVGANNSKSFMYENCKEKLMNDIAIVEVLMDSPTVVKYIQTYKASTTDKLANFGKCYANGLYIKDTLNIYYIFG